MLSSLLSKLQDEELLKRNIIVNFCSNNDDKKRLYELFLEILKEGKSYPHTLPYSFEEFLAYFFSKNSHVLICKKDEREVIGGFYLRPNFAGRASHIANCGYLVKKEYRGQKIGFHLGECSIDIAKELGYRSMIFNLVFRENTEAVNLWKKLGFKIIATIPDGIKNDNETFQDAYIMFLELKKFKFN